MRTNLQLLLLAWVSLLFGPVLGELRFCENKPAERSDFCIAINTVHNETTTVDDWYVSISAQFMAGSDGWLAFGAGNYIMHRTLMFVMYPGIERGSVVLGPRSTQFHEEPKYTPDLPEVDIKRTDFTNGYHVVDFVCYGCNLWDGHALRPDDTSQPWIWATNPFQKSKSNDPNKKLDRHVYFGSMLMDMSSSKSSKPVSPTIANTIGERVSIHASYLSTEKHGSSTSSYVLHGILLATAFGLLYPAGIVAALGEHRWKSIKSHWVVQSATATCALFGVALGLYNSIKTGGLGSLLNLHQALGCIAGLALLTQGFLGWRHHVIYVKTRAVTSLKVFHVWLGRGLYGLGSINVVLGLLGHSKRWLAVFWAVLVALHIIAYFMFLRRRGDDNHGEMEQSQHTYVYKHIAKEEDTDTDQEVETKV